MGVADSAARTRCTTQVRIPIRSARSSRSEVERAARSAPSTLPVRRPLWHGVPAREALPRLRPFSAGFLRTFCYLVASQPVIAVFRLTRLLDALNCGPEPFRPLGISRPDFYRNG